MTTGREHLSDTVIIEDFSAWGFFILLCSEAYWDPIYTVAFWEHDGMHSSHV